MTMTSFSTLELTAMQETQDSAMMDLCDLLTLFQTDRVDEYGHPVMEWITREKVICGLDMRESGEVRNAEANLWDARLRLPINTLIGRVDRVVITQRFGVMLDTPLLYQVEGEAERGPSGLVLRLRNV